MDNKDWVVKAKVCECVENDTWKIEYDKANKTLKNLDTKFNQSLKRYGNFI